MKHAAQNIIAATVLALFVLSQAHAASALTYYVSTHGNDSWEGLTPDPASDASNGPFLTLEKARDAVRAAIAAGLTESIRIEIRGGNYFFPDGFTLDKQDSGTDDFGITYAAYLDEEVRLYGGTVLDTWTPGESDTLVSSFPHDRYDANLFEDGRRLQRMRYPKEGYLRVAGPGETEPATISFVYAPEDVSIAKWDRQGITCFFWPQHDWFSNELHLLRFVRDKNTAVLRGNTSYPIEQGDRYCLRNVPVLPELPGDVWFNLDTDQVVCKPYHPDAASRVMLLSTAQTLVKIQGEAPYNLVRNLHFENLRLSVAAQDVLVFENAVNCSITGCIVESGDRNGIVLTGHAQGINVRDNVIREHGLDGVFMQGLPPGEEYVNFRNRIESNRIHHCGRLVGHGAGIHITQSGENRIEHNVINDMPRYGISLKGTCFQQLLKQFPGVMWVNHYDYIHSRGNSIAYNDIHHVNLDSEDTGAIEAWGAGRDNRLANNLIHDVGNDALPIQSGIYIDDSSDMFKIENNIIYNVHGAGGDQCMYVKGVGNRISNNILVVGPTNQSAIRSFAMAGERCDTHRYERNIFYFEGEGGAIYDFNNWSDNRVVIAGKNLFFKPNGALTVLGGPDPGGWDAYRAVRDGVLDADSVNADPKFLDAANHNYELAPDSPALALGFVSISQNEIGLMNTFPGRLNEE